MATPRFSHLRAGDLATLHAGGGVTVPVRVTAVLDGNTVEVETTAERPGHLKGANYRVLDNLTAQGVTTRTKSQTTLLVFTR